MKPVNMAVTQPFGKRGPMWKSCGYHTGDDFPCALGTRLVAAISGTIRHRDYGKAFGKHQFVISPSPGQPFADHEVFYAHTRTRLPDGTEVQMGDFVAESGAEGNVSGPHLHFEYHTAKNVWNCGVCVDPQPIYDHGPQTGGGGGGGGGGASSGGQITTNIYSDRLGFGEPTNGDDSSDTVKELQRKLNGISLVGGRTLPITGNYAEMTDEEVRKWQEQVCGDTPDPAGRSYLGPRQREKMFPAAEGYTIHDRGLPRIAGGDSFNPGGGIPACPPATDFKPGVTNEAFTWMGERFLVWLSPQEIAKAGAAYVPGPKFSTYDEENIRKCQAKMGNTPDSPGTAFFGPRQWDRLGGPPSGGGGDVGGGAGDGVGDTAPPGGAAWFVPDSLKALRDEVNARWPDRSTASDGTIGDTAHSQSQSEHNPVGHQFGPQYGTPGAVHAMDITAEGIDVQVLLDALIGDQRVWYVIHDGHIWSKTYGWEKRPYTGSNPHRTHVHVSLRADDQADAVRAEQDTSTWLEPAEEKPVPPPEPGQPAYVTREEYQADMDRIAEAFRQAGD